MNTPRRFDHLVLATRDLAAMQAAYAALGFTLTPRAAHPWGTGNHLVQLQGNFLELLGLDDPARIPPHGPRHFSFGAYNRDFLAEREGFSMLVFASTDAEADRRDFAAAGFGPNERFDFSRDAKLPDGTIARVGFSLAFAVPPDWPEVVFFTCQQHAPQHFWRPEYQRHANTAERVVEVVMVADEPTAVADRLARLTHAWQEPVRGGVRFTTPEGGNDLTVLTPAAALARWPGSVVSGRLPNLLGYRLLVADLDAAARCLESGKVNFTRAGGRLTTWAFGAVIEFEGR